MKLNIEPTDEFFMLGEVMVRAWRGSDQDGVGVVALVSLVRTESLEDVPGLVSIPAPTPEDAVNWAKRVLSEHEG